MPAPKYAFSLKIGDKLYTSKDADPLVALTTLARPEKIVGKGVLTVSCGKKKKELLMMPIQLKRMFYPSAQPILIKNLITGLK